MGLRKTERGMFLNMLDTSCFIHETRYRITNLFFVLAWWFKTVGRLWLLTKETHRWNSILWPHIHIKQQQ